MVEMEDILQCSDRLRCCPVSWRKGKLHYLPCFLGETMASTICQDDANFNFLRCLNKCDGEVNGIANVVTNHSLIFMDLRLKMLVVYSLQLYL